MNFCISRRQFGMYSKTNNNSCSLIEYTKSETTLRCFRLLTQTISATNLLKAAASFTLQKIMTYEDNQVFHFCKTKFPLAQSMLITFLYLQNRV